MSVPTKAEPKGPAFFMLSSLIRRGFRINHLKKIICLCKSMPVIRYYI